MQSNLVETLIGAIVVVIAGVFLFYGYSNSGMRSAGGYHVKAEFDRVDGLATGSDVRLSGIKVGTVVRQAIDPKNYQAVVTMSLAPDVKIPDDSSAKITSEGLLGSNYIALTPGGSEEFLADGGEISFTQGSVDLMGLIGQAIFSTSSGKSGDKAAPSPSPTAPQ
ncbi:MAG: outer membrane lipid asymmetry maintenance protein MlaD [Parvibaculum sp.]|uniref:outer membrane lipid asymmetry maintenance protein MlaD n=1 Tax=Parvibaculum sp. TaxID=2024848 RepID=UPI0025E00D3B|nr:outer membrane lipid asymmetry maintenance protein MlaD [Parvibaculum sp.]MCE9648837.1 outer membrane lipid asymmetry maintenance protein MlaD [Parvibaculum sp.]